MARRPGCSSSTSSSSPSADRRDEGTTFVADRGDAARRLDRALLRHAGHDGLSRTIVQRLIAQGGVTVNGRPAAKPAQRLQPGDRVWIAATAPAPRRAPLVEDTELDVVHEDAHLLVVNKPPGLVVHPTRRHPTGTLLNAVLGYAARQDVPWQPHLVQRLDKGTSGLLVIAKSRQAYAALQRAGFEKEYLALVWGRPSPPRGRIERRLGRDPLDRRRVVPRREGALAITDYRTIARTTGARRGLTLLACRLVTGRTHQLRVHLADSGWPLVGDPVYRAVSPARLADAATHRRASTFGRQALHAWRIALQHPVDGTRLELEAALPRDLRSLWSGVGLPLHAPTRGTTRPPNAFAPRPA